MARDDRNLLYTHPSRYLSRFSRAGSTIAYFRWLLFFGGGVGSGFFCLEYLPATRFARYLSLQVLVLVLLVAAQRSFAHSCFTFDDDIDTIPSHIYRFHIKPEEKKTDEYFT